MILFMLQPSLLWPLMAIGTQTNADLPLLEHRIREAGTLRVRMDALDGFVAAAPSEDRVRVLEILRTFLDEARPERIRDAKSVDVVRRMQGLNLIDHFLDKSVLVVAADKAAIGPLIVFLTDLATTRFVPGTMSSLACDRLMEVLPSDEARLEHQLQFIESESIIRRQVAGILTRKPELAVSAAVRLRSTVRQGLDRQHVNAVALAVLGHYGDEEIVADLEAAKATFTVNSPEWGKLEYAIRQTRVQHPPDGLLQFLRDGGNWLQAGWVVERTVQLGIPKAQIRAAVIDYCAKCPAEALVRQRLSGLDRAVIDGGVMERDDLPDIVLPKNIEIP